MADKTSGPYTSGERKSVKPDHGKTGKLDDTKRSVNNVQGTAELGKNRKSYSKKASY